MPDAYFDDEYLASLYDRLERHDGADDQFYLTLAHGADRVLDVGCGTGQLLHRLRDEGHQGRLVGVDPAAGMMTRARRREDVEWRQGYLAEQGFAAEFDLAIMTGHAFQVLLTDDDVVDLLAGARGALAPGGHFAFETRNPHVRPWKRWTPDDRREVTDTAGRQVSVWHDLIDVEGEFVTFTETFAVAGEAEPRASRSTLRFLSAGDLDRLLRDAGFVVDERYGDWDRRPFTADSPEIITVASR